MQRMLFRRSLASLARSSSMDPGATEGTLSRDVQSDRMESKMNDFYFQESFEAIERMKKNTTYPGPIKAATPGDTRFYYDKRVETILHEQERHYWRVVVDDPLIEDIAQLRIRFKENVFCAPRWETRLHVITIPTTTDISVQELIGLIKRDSAHAFLAHTAFDLALNGRALAPDKLLSEYGISDNMSIDAIEKDKDHLWHLPEGRPKDWNTAEVSATEAKQSPYKEITEAFTNEDNAQATNIFTKPTDFEAFGHYVR